MALTGFLSIDIISIAPSDNIFVNVSEGEVKGSSMSKHKQEKKAKNWISVTPDRDGLWPTHRLSHPVPSTEAIIFDAIIPNIKTKLIFRLGFWMKIN